MKIHFLRKQNFLHNSFVSSQRIFSWETFSSQFPRENEDELETKVYDATSFKFLQFWILSNVQFNSSHE